MKGLMIHVGNKYNPAQSCQSHVIAADQYVRTTKWNSQS